MGLADLFLEVQEVVFETKIFLLEEHQANGAGVLREALDAGFNKRPDWKNAVTGGVDWVKRVRYNSTFIARIGLEIQVSARSDLVIRDIVHLRNSLQNSEIDVGVIVLPSVKMSGFLTDRTPSIKDGVRYITEEFKEAMTFPIVLIAVEHDGPGEPLAKKVTNRGQGKAKRAGIDDSSHGTPA